MNLKKISPIMETYSRFDVSMSFGKGCWLFDEKGNKYLDALSGIAVNTLGHCHPKLTAALSEQMKQLVHTSNLYKIPLQEKLAYKLTKISSLNYAFFCNSGLEANEAAIKIARKHGQKLGYSKPKIIVFEKSFHGRSIATISASANPLIKKGFEPLLDGFIRIPLNKIEKFNELSKSQQEISAVFLETIQGEGGINIPQEKYLLALREICTKNNWLLILDEVQCGIGRTGKWFAYQWENIKPDVVPLAKGLGSGIPIGAVLTNETSGKLMGPGSHGTTFGGNPFAMRAGIETLKIIEEENLMENAIARGKQILESLNNAFCKNKEIVEIRGCGLMIGIELKKPCKEIARIALEKGLLINVTESNVIRLLPPLIISKDEVEILTKRLIPVIKEFI
ncbi:MAG: aspartate aminotransferase family protein [Betaproteobacteria bacterium TMED100]|nr:MAG: aspartate aminotransferase family protein [Betaproteobacteria bacterium TMED100]